MKRFSIIILLATLAIVALTAMLDHFRLRSFVTRVQTVNLGDTRAQVVAKVGQATHVFTPPKEIPSGLWLGVRVETWAYGKRFDWHHCFYSEFPYFFPLRFRLFGPDPDDVQIEFDPTGRVNRVFKPTT